MVDIMLRAAIAAVALAEAASLLVGAALHLGLPVSAPFFEPRYLPSAVLEGAAGAMLVYAVWGIATRPGRAWKMAVTAHVFAVAAVVFGIGARATGRAARMPTETGHHPATLLALIVVLVALALPPCRRALGDARRRSRRRRRGRKSSNPVPRL